MCRDAAADSEDDPAGWSGGFDVVLGNPPWERINLNAKEWFSSRRPEISNASTSSARDKMIAEIAEQDPALYASFCDARRSSDGLNQLVRNSGRYPLSSRGDINTYSVFVELNWTLLSPTGRVGCVVPSGIASDETTQFLFQHLVDSRSLVSMYDFENRNGIFPQVHRSYKFSLLTLRGDRAPSSLSMRFVFFALYRGYLSFSRTVVFAQGNVGFKCGRHKTAQHDDGMAFVLRRSESCSL